MGKERKRKKRQKKKRQKIRKKNKMVLMLTGNSVKESPNGRSLFGGVVGSATPG